MSIGLAIVREVVRWALNLLVSRLIRRKRNKAEQLVEEVFAVAEYSEREDVAKGILSKSSKRRNKPVF